MKDALTSKLQKIIDHQYDDENVLLLHLAQLVRDTELKNAKSKDAESIAHLVFETLAKLEQKDVPEDVFRTGLTALDSVIHGFSLGEYIVIGSRPAMGKFQLMSIIALEISKKAPILFFTFDKYKYSVTERFLRILSRISNVSLRTNDLNDDQKTLLFKAAETLSNRKIFINDSCANSVTAIREQCVKMVEENGVKLVFIDYLQLIRSLGFRNNKNYEISYISGELKNIARDLNICVVVNSQLSRAVESRSGEKRPYLNDLRDSGSIEQDADKVLFIYRPEYYCFEVDADGNSTKNLIELIVAKNNNGETSSVKLLKSSDFNTITDYIEQEYRFNFNESRLDEITEDDDKNQPF